MTLWDNTDLKGIAITINEYYLVDQNNVCNLFLFVNFSNKLYIKIFQKKHTTTTI